MALKFRDFYKPKKKPVEEPKETEVVVQKPVILEMPEREPISKDNTERSFAVFAVGQEWFAVDLDATLEILHEFETVLVPHLPESFSGVVNLRGESVPVVNLQKLLKEKSRPNGTRTCLITLINSTKIGFLIDSDVEIIKFVEGKFYPLPDCYTAEEAKFLEGIFWVGDRFVGILRPDQAFEVLTEWRLENENE